MYHTFKEMNELLMTAANLNFKNCGGKSIEGIASITGISTAMLYKWRSGNSNLSGDKFDKLLNYFQIEEPERLKTAERILGW